MKNALHLIAGLLLVQQALLAQTPVTFNSSGTYTVPPGVYAVTVEMWGAGGYNPSFNAGAGGGAYLKSKPLAVIPGSNMAVYVGSGSSTASIFGDLIGISGGIGQNGGLAATGDKVQVSFKGGNGGNGGTNIFTPYYGGGGAAGGPLGNGTNGQNGTSTSSSAQGGNGALSGGGSGGNGGSTFSNGSPGGAPGGGRGGKGTVSSGNGRVIVTPFCIPFSPRVASGNIPVADGDNSPALEDSTEFGPINYLGGSSFRKFTIQNTGNNTIGVGSITLTGAEAASFSISGASFPLTINPGTSTSFNVVFTPKTAGLKTANLSINYNHCTDPVFNFTIQGTGSCVEGGATLLKFKDITIADGDNTPSFSDSTDFGNIGFNGYSSLKTYTIQNPGTGPIRINNLNIAGPDAAFFSVETLNFPLIIPPGGNKTFWIRFSPTGSGQKNATITLSAENCTLNDYDFAISGTGVCITADNPQVKGNEINIADGDITPSTNDHTDFGNVGYNGFSLNRSFTIKNPGIKPLQITGITLSGANTSLFSIQNIDFPKTIPAGDSATFEVKFTPLSDKVGNAVVNIATDNCGIANYDFAIKGTGICDPAGAPKVLGQNRVVIADGDNSPSLDDLTSFGSVGTGGFFSTRTFIIQNPSPGPVTVNSITQTGTNAEQFTVSNITLPLNIPANGEVSFLLKLTPTADGLKSATVNIGFTNCNISVYDFAVSGTGVAPSKQSITSSGNFNPPPGITNVLVAAWGAGANSPSNSIHGGGGGAFVLSNGIPVIPGTNIPVTIGAPGGSNTSFGNFVTANNAIGQVGGTISTGPNIALSYTGGNGGTGAASFGFSYGGGGGGAGGTSGKGEDGTNASFSSTGQGGNGGTGGGKGGWGGSSTVFGYDGGPGLPPGGGGGGIKGKGAIGAIEVTYACPGAGTIGTSHSIPYPPQLVPDIIESFEGLAPTAENKLVYSWQQSTDNSTWVPAKTPTSGLTYQVDKDSIQVKTWYRRVNNSCGTTNYSNVVAINVIKTLNGAISGTVRSKNGSPVKGITVYAQKVNKLPGSPVSWIDSAVTGIDGQYTIEKVYYGDPNEGTNNGSVSTDFIITPYKLNHGFKPASLPKKLTNNIPQIVNVDFTDTTVYAITGKIIQECVGCLNSSDVEETSIGTVDSVDMFLNNSMLTKSGRINGLFGRYALSVTDPETYKVEPKFKNHKFNPSFNNVLVENNVDNVDFKDTTIFTITGNLTAGCNDYIGTAVLEFTDILPNDPEGNPRASQFRKRVTTNPGSGNYTITLPARKWRVKVVSFSPAIGGDVQSPDLLAFFETKIHKDSLVRDISTANATLNLVYNRPPQLEITGLDPVCTVPTPFAIIEQSKEKTFTVKAWQGPAAKNCPATDTSLFINTNIQLDDLNEVIELKTVNGSAQVKLTGGIPNIVSPHFKVLNLVYTDANGFTTQLNRNVVVTGLKSDIGSFATVSPEIPLMILHDPPGDNSFSFWETSKSNETASRFYAAVGGEATAWAEVKVGAKFSAGLGVTVETDIWGTVKGSVTVAGRVNNAKEVVMTTTTTNTFSTASNDAVVGAQGDVFIGAALNLLYAPTNQLSFNPATCNLKLERRLMIAQDGFATQYIYSEDHIRNTLLPTLRAFRDNPGNSQVQTNNYINQIKVWEQTLANNDANKKKAAFDKNISFDGSSGPITSTTTTSSSKSNTIEFDLSVNAELAIELGLDVGGVGASGGVTVGFKMETGGSTTNTVLNSTTIGYTLDDDDNGDFYSVNIKKDPVYNTPVFELVAGTTSCPYEPGSQPRDQMQLIVPEPVKTNVDPNGEAEFILKLSNTSQSAERRTYSLSFIQGSNPNGAVVTIGGSPAVNPISYSIDYLGEVNVLVKVKRGASSIYSYEGLQFRLTDACDGSIEKTARISAFFTATCSPIELVQPEPNWLNTKADNNILPILFKGYSIANTTSVTLEYQRVGANNWITGFIRTAAELNNSVNGTLVNWNVGSLADGGYNLRMKLNCPAGVVNSQRSSGIIDRVSPNAVGNPEPTDDEFVRGDQISIQYNEPLDCSGVTPSDVEIKRLSNGQIVQANVGCFQNKIVVVPLVDISTWTGDSVMISVNNISDQYGNGKTIADKWSFVVGNTIPATGPRALTISSSGTPGGFAGGKAAPLSGASVNEDDGVPIKFVFELGANATQDMLINYTVSGSGVFMTDYNIDYSQPQNLATVFNGATGSLTLKKGNKKIELSIIPIPNQYFEPDKTITITLAEGGDYELGAVVTATGTILNDDSPKVYIFTGSGNYNVPANWDNNIVPPTQILIGDEVIIDPPNGGECILNVPVTVMPGAKFEVKPGKVLRINNSLQVKKKL